MKKFPLASLLAVLAATGAPVPALGDPAPREPQELTPADAERIRKAKEKRARKAAKRAAAK